MFLYTNNELSKREINNTIPFKIVSKIIKTHRNINKGNEKPVDWKLKEINKRNGNASKIFHACGLEKLILLNVHTTQRKS